MKLVDKVSRIQGALKAPKGQTNNFGKYKYRSAEDILEAVKPLTTEHGLILTLSDEIVEVSGRIYVKATARLTDGEAELKTTAFAREEETKKGMDGSQVTGASSSYARKYALNGLFCIDDTKDSDSTNTHGHTSPGRVNAPAVSKEKLASAKKQIDTGKKLVSLYDQCWKHIDQSKNKVAAVKAVLKKHRDNLTEEQVRKIEDIGRLAEAMP
mgnify:CR=1 FL=1|tara:strand:+ start:310 stop:945 length:636 start_codon:yes stop_codon:yes gene_type:complete